MSMHDEQPEAETITASWDEAMERAVGREDTAMMDALEAAYEGDPGDLFEITFVDGVFEDATLAP